jgi:ketohexokinase
VNAISSLPNLHEIGWVHFEGRIPDVLLAAMPQIKSLLHPETILSIEFEKPDRVGLEDLIEYANIAIFSRTYFMHWARQQPQVAGETLLNRFFKKVCDRSRTTHAIITMGEEGACLSGQPRRGEHISFGTDKVPVIDATGAGDTFLAGFIWALGARKASEVDGVKFAVKLATIKVAQEGFDGIWQKLISL